MVKEEEGEEEEESLLTCEQQEAEKWCTVRVCACNLLCE